MLVGVALVALGFGACVGFLVGGVLNISHDNEEMEEAQWTIRKQAKVIADQGTIIAELNRQLDGLEDDGK